MRPGLSPAAEWPATLDVAALRASGWQPTPFQEFVLKIHSRCDLACDYCYMYTSADQSWRSQPVRMPPAVIALAADRIAEHARGHGLTELRLVLHGGEPLLAGPDVISSVVTMVANAVGDDVRVETSVQTNCMGLDDRYLALFERLGIQVGVSLDGGVDAHDRHRRYASGRGTHDVAAARLRRLTSDRYRHLFRGLLCVVDVRNDPLAVYEALCEFDPPRVDFLLPHGNWQSPPPGRQPNSTATPYADWLIAIFDEWYYRPRTEVRLFSEIIRLILGMAASTESVGLAPASFLIIETDGAIAQVDTLKTTFPGAPDTGLHVENNQFDEALMLPEIAARQVGYEALSPDCKGCRLGRICGGGLYAHRYRPGTGFANPSVYCPDLMRLIDHIRATVAADALSRRTTQQTA